MRRLLAAVLFGCSACASGGACPPRAAPPSVASRRAEIDAFNQTMVERTRRLDTAGLLAQWQDDGATLLPGERPIEGKVAIGKFLAAVDAQMPGARMKTFDMTCAGIEIEGDFASEYCDEHQVVDLGEGKKTFDGRGKMLFVLHRGADGTWRLQREMWNQGAEPDAVKP